MEQRHSDVSLGGLRVQGQLQPFSQAALALECPPAPQPSRPSQEATTLTSTPQKPCSPVSTKMTPLSTQPLGVVFRLVASLQPSWSCLVP